MTRCGVRSAPAAAPLLTLEGVPETGLSLMAAVLPTGNRDHAETKETEVALTRRYALSGMCGRGQAGAMTGSAILGHMVGHLFAQTPEPPYVAVIFTSTRTEGDRGYAVTAASMDAFAAEQPGFLGIESVRDDAIGITVSYWTDHKAARDWKAVAAHLVAQQRGREVWYQDYRVRVATVERDYIMESSQLDGMR